MARYASRVPTPTRGIRSSLPRKRSRLRNSRRLTLLQARHCAVRRSPACARRPCAAGPAPVAPFPAAVGAGAAARPSQPAARHRSGSPMALTASARPAPGYVLGQRRCRPGAPAGISRRSSTCRCWWGRPAAGLACVACSATHTEFPAGSAPRPRAGSRSSGRRECAGCARLPAAWPNPVPLAAGGTGQ